MKLCEISRRPTTVTAEKLSVPGGPRGIHESCLRAYQILEKVKYLLSEQVPAKIILELIEEMEGTTDPEENL